MVEFHKLTETNVNTCVRPNKGLQCDVNRASGTGKIKGDGLAIPNHPPYSTFSISGGPQLYLESPQSGIPRSLPSLG